MSMTIKQAFEKLTMVCGAALKNPFFVQRNLHDAFADIAANIEEGGGGGSTVEVTQIVSTGTKIATITVDDTPTDLYAPVPQIPGDDYSTTDTVIGSWLGTKDVHRVVVNLSSSLTFSGQGTELPAAVASAISGCDYVVECIGIASNTCAYISIEYMNSKWTGYSSEDWTLDKFIVTYVK